MPKASTLTEDFRFMALFVGEKHTGKTCAACSFPKPVENLDFDGRIRGLLGAPWLDREGISYESYPPKSKDLVKRLDDKFSSYQAMGIVDQLELKTEILDSLTSETYAMLTQGIAITHDSGSKNKAGGIRGRFLGNVAMAGPEEYGYEAQTTYDILAALRSIPIPNVIATAHIIDKFGKEDPEDKYSPSVVIGEKLSLRDKIGANIGIYFDHIFRFRREMVNKQERFTVQFRGDIACTSYASLPLGIYDITGKNFYEFMMDLIQKGKSNGIPEGSLNSINPSESLKLAHAKP